jgi:hypothetical protein
MTSGTEQAVIATYREVKDDDEVYPNIYATLSSTLL